MVSGVAEGVAQTTVHVQTENGDVRWVDNLSFLNCRHVLHQRNWECQAGLECIMHPGKELGQCMDIDECTVSRC